MEKSKLFSIRNFGILFTFLSAFLLVSITSCDMKPPKNSKWAQAVKGKEHFAQYCSSCHGIDGKGIKVDSLSKRPADLTQIRSSTSNNEFPIMYVASMIDGRKMAKSHGSRDMPVWGEVFSKQENLTEDQIKGKLAEIIAYLMLIQS